MDLPSNFKVLDTAEAVADLAVSNILLAAEAAITAKGSFHLVTAGGSTPLRCYQKLRLLEADWQNWHIYMGDERCLPPEDTDRNSLALQLAWLDFGQIPKPNIHFMPAELGAKKAAENYQKQLSQVAEFDVVLLGMGEDGHTASLFPGHDYPQAVCVEEYHSPKPPSERISLSYQTLSNAKLVIKLITGSTKKQAISQWVAGETLPINQVKGQTNLVLLDASALPELD